MQRQDILRSAAQIFRLKGFHGTSMQDIADAVHLQKASLYHHIHSKQEILLGILDEALDTLIADLRPIVDSEQAPAQKLDAAMRAYIDRMTHNADLAAVLLLEHRSLEPALRHQHVIRRDRYESLWRQIIRQGVQQGAFRPVDEAVTSFALLGVQNWLITWYREGGRLSPAQLADQFVDLFLRGLSAEGGPA
jgi:AcrR family transcriptional regulator